jgi:hypothetical protein
MLMTPEPPSALGTGEPQADPAIATTATATTATATTGAATTGTATTDGTPGPARRTKRGRGLARGTHHWSRVIHVYTSMIALVVVLFFAATGLTLNHPGWTFGDDPTTTTTSGTFPFATELVADDGTAAGVDFLSIAEYVRDDYGVVGSVDSFDETNGQGSIAFVNPGYRADLLFDVATGTFDLTVEQEGWVAVVNDLHKGRSTGGAWKWLIDVSAGFLIVVSVTGLVMQFFLKKRRRSAFVAAGAGLAVVLAVAAVTLR